MTSSLSTLHVPARPGTKTTAGTATAQSGGARARTPPPLPAILRRSLPPPPLSIVAMAVVAADAIATFTWGAEAVLLVAPPSVRQTAATTKGGWGAVAVHGEYVVDGSPPHPPLLWGA